MLYRKRSSLLKNPFMSFSLTPGRKLRAPLLGVLSPVRDH